MALTGLKGRLAAAQPSDIIFIAYVSFTGILIALYGWQFSPRLWIGLTLTHVALIGAGLWFAGQPLHYPSFRGFIRDIYPILAIVYLYWELRYLALLFSGGYQDPLILRLEEMLFGEQLAMTFSERFPYLWLSELMHFAYGTYWMLLPSALALLYLRRRIDGFRELVYVEMVIFFGCYLVFIFFPVQGPHYEFPLIGGRLAEAPMYRFVHWVLEDGGSKGAAFPSSHVAVAVAILLVTWRHDRQVWLVVLPLVVGLTVGTVYGRFHYGVDATSGIAAAVVFYLIAKYLHRFWSCEVRRGPGGWSESGNSAEGPPV
ncbi:MAG: phosphatase PAP2 family protein [Gemmatimonadota bacterium]|nr:MAG: phosphatase PAP2 family protein [Gemmatimonadota bacterium]